MALEPLIAADFKGQGCKRVGYTEDGRSIWEETVDLVVGKEPIVVGGVEQWVKVNGDLVKPKMRLIREKVTRRFVEEKTPDGGAFKNYNFEPDPEEAARIVRRKEVETVKQSLAEKLVERGLSVDDLLDAVSTPKRARKAE